MVELSSKGLVPEWAPQDAVLMAWPAEHTDWADRLVSAQACFRSIIETIVDYQRVVLVCPPGAIPGNLPADVLTVELPYNDTWVRDSGPLTVDADDPCWIDCRFDAWGGKFSSALDDQLVARLSQTRYFDHLSVARKEWVLEGGAIETDGAGSLLTTSQCCNARYSQMSRADIGRRLTEALGLERVLWLDHGDLIGDDTDGHIDTLARFASDELIVYQGCEDRSDVHYRPLQSMAAQLRELTSSTGGRYHLSALPLPGEKSLDGERLPAGYANFLIINDAVIVPTYADPADNDALSIIGDAFPDRRIVGVDCLELIVQGGSLHCSTMQLPSGCLT